MSLRRYLAISLLTVVSFHLAGNAAFAARLLTATVEVDGKVVLKSMLSDDGSSPPNVLWQQLGGNLSWEEGSAPISPKDQDAGRARLEGDVVIRIRHVDRVLVQESPTELTLVRNAAGTAWCISTEELDRIAPARVIPQPPPILKSSEIVTLAAFAVCGTAVLILGAWFILRQTGRRAPRKSS